MVRSLPFPKPPGESDSKISLMPFPLDESSLYIHHRIDNQFGKAAVQDALFLPEIIIGE